jgi:hypothetical protein
LSIESGRGLPETEMRHLCRGRVGSQWTILYAQVNVDRLHTILFIHTSIEIHVGCFHLFDIINNASVNMGVQITLQVLVFTSFGYILKNEIPGSSDNFILNILRNWI